MARHLPRLRSFANHVEREREVTPPRYAYFAGIQIESGHSIVAEDGRVWTFSHVTAWPDSPRIVARDENGFLQSKPVFHFKDIEVR